MILTEGGHFGDLYVRDFKRDDNGKPVKTESGAPELGGTIIRIWYMSVI